MIRLPNLRRGSLAGIMPHALIVHLALAQVLPRQCVRDIQPQLRLRQMRIENQSSAG